MLPAQVRIKKTFVISFRYLTWPYTIYRSRMQKQTINILLANDHEIIRRGINILFKSHAPHIKIAGEAGSFEEILTILPQLEVDILMTDDMMPKGNILTFLPIIKEQYPELKIIINSIVDAHAMHCKKTMEWVEGWVGFTAHEQDYIKAVETVYCGGYYFYVKGFDKEI